MLHQIMFQLNPQILFEFIGGYKAVMFLMLIGYLLHFIPKHMELKAEQIVSTMSLELKAAFMLSIIVIVIQTKSSGIQPFIYFQF